MYNPFVKACNCALDELSRCRTDELPNYSVDNQIVFVRNHDRSVKSHDLNRDCRARPDIVLLRWKHFEEKSGVPGGYSASYKSDACVGRSTVELSWKDVRSTVEVKLLKFPEHKKWKESADFDKKFGTLTESEPYTSLDDVGAGFIEPIVPEPHCKCALLGRSLSLICLGRWLPELNQAGCGEKGRHGGRLPCSGAYVDARKA